MKSGRGTNISSFIGRTYSEWDTLTLHSVSNCYVIDPADQSPDSIINRSGLFIHTEYRNHDYDSAWFKCVRLYMPEPDFNILMKEYLVPFRIDGIWVEPSKKNHMELK